MPTIEWFNEDNTLIDTKESNKYQAEYDSQSGVAKLLVMNVSRRDEMSYKCVATNEHGTAKTVGVLVIKGNSWSLRSYQML